MVNVLRDLGLKELYQGQIALVTGEVDEDIEAYLRTSEQVPSALGCDVLLDGSGRVAAAAGVLVQAMPGGDPDIVRDVQHALRTGSSATLLGRGRALREDLRRARLDARRPSSSWAAIAACASIAAARPSASARCWRSSAPSTSTR